MGKSAIPSGATVGVGCGVVSRVAGEDIGVGARVTEGFFMDVEHYGKIKHVRVGGALWKDKTRAGLVGLPTDCLVVSNV
jgi:hypothetical protein